MFGPYIFIIFMVNSFRFNDADIRLPDMPLSTDMILYSKVLLIKIATPLAFFCEPFSKHSPAHKVFINFLSSLNQCVSCRQSISGLMSVK